jgi:DNA polymerase III delta subunit
VSKPAGKAARDLPVVLFLGDPTVVDPLVHALVDERMAASSQSLDFEIFRYGERPLDGIEASLRQVGMFSAGRCIWLRGLVESVKKGATSQESDGIPEGEDEEGEATEEESPATRVLELLEGGLPPGTLFVVSAAGLDARGRLFKWFAKNADVRDRRVQVENSGARRGKLGEQGLRAAIEARLQDLDVRHVGAGALEEIVRRSGNVLGETIQEIDRVVLAQEDPSRLTAAGVRGTMRDLALGWIFDLTEALEKRNLAAAENLIERLLAEGEAPLRLSSLLTNHFGLLLAARPVVDTLPRDWRGMRGHDFLAGPGSSLPAFLRGWPGYFRLKASSNFAYEELHRIHGEMRRLDLALKSSALDPLLLFSRLLQATCLAARGR